LDEVDDEEEWRFVRPLPIVHATGEHILISMTGLRLQQQTSIVDAINWICCSIRPTPELPIQNGNNVFISSRSGSPTHMAVGDVHLVGQSLGALRIASGDDLEPHSCWTRLFRAVIASWHKLNRDWGTGLELSYPLLRHLAATPVSVTLGEQGDDAVVDSSNFKLVGFFTAPIPVDWQSDGSNLDIQWHFEANDPKEALLDSSFLPDMTRLPGRLDVQLEKLRRAGRQPRCFLGWCDNANVLLGTRGLEDQLDCLMGSGLKTRERSIHIGGVKLGGNVGAGGGPMAPANVGINAGLDLIFRPNIQGFDPATAFNAALIRERDKVAFVYDNGSNQAWLVPQLSLMLHLCHKFFRDCFPETQDPIPFAKPQPDGSLAALRALTSLDTQTA
jgi:hypothetical protein